MLMSGQINAQKCREVKAVSYSIIELPSFDVNDSEATITDVFVKNREKIDRGKKLFAVENTKAVNIIEATESGYIFVICKKFDVKKTGDKLAYLFDNLEELGHFETEEVKKENNESINATKKALELATELGVNIRDVAAEKEGEVIKVKDVQSFFDKHSENKPSPYSHIFKYDRERVVIAGAGNGAEVVIDILRDDHEKDIVGLIDDNVKKFANYDYKIFECGILEFPNRIDCCEYDTVIISIGATLKSMRFRKMIFEKYKEVGIRFTNAIAKSADIRRGVKIGVGNIIGAQSYIGTLTEIGDNNSISYGTFIGHHNLVGSNNLIAPGFISSGSVEIGDGCVIPAGVVTRNCVKIGNNVVLPVGYAVVNSIDKDTIVQEQLFNGNE